MNEFDLIKTFFDKGNAHDSVIQGIGDDCAVLQAPKDQRLVLSIDTQVAGCHFPRDASPDLMAGRALHCAVSDLAAMGAEPLWFTLALTMPHANEAWLEGFSRGLFTAASIYDMPLVGGDTTKGPLTISVQVHGAVPAETTLWRSRANVGDHIFVTGCLGDGAAGLAVINGQLQTDADSANYLRQRYYAPEARIDAGILLRYLANAAIDISDGLVADLNHLCTASQVGAVIDAARLPISPQLLASAPTRRALDWALSGGDDYQLCFTASPEQVELLTSKSKRHTIDATCIGEIVAGNGVVDRQSGKLYGKTISGYSHFS